MTSGVDRYLEEAGARISVSSKPPEYAIVKIPIKFNVLGIDYIVNTQYTIDVVNHTIYEVRSI